MVINKSEANHYIVCEGIPPYTIEDGALDVEFLIK